MKNSIMIDGVVYSFKIRLRDSILPPIVVQTANTKNERLEKTFVYGDLASTMALIDGILRGIIEDWEYKLK